MKDAARSDEQEVQKSHAFEPSALGFWSLKTAFALVVLLCAPSAGASSWGVKRVNVQTPRVFTTASAASEADLCAPCKQGSQCDSGLCAIGNDGNGLCSQPCSASNACPTNFSCTAVSSDTSLCYPVDDTVCPTPYLAGLNTYCQVPATSSDANSGISRQCDKGLTCFVFPSGYGTCVTQCSSINSSQSCSFGQKCCFGTDSNGNCLASTSTQNVGGCFTIAQYGGSCAQPDHSFCQPGSVCLYAQAAAAAACYITCSSGTCGNGGTCQAFMGYDVCCKSTLYNPEDATTCQPYAGVCRREVGVVCSSNNDCLSGLCLKNNTQAACSIPCTTDADCPTAREDVNGDGVADGGSTCITLGNAQRCWPKLGPAKEPNCAFNTANQSVTKRQGCSCEYTKGPPEGALLGAMVSLAVYRRMRRRFRPRV